MTSGNQFAKTDFTVELNGDNSSAQISSRSVAKGNSKQEFYSALHGNAECSGHSECDSIIMENGFVKSVPEIIANDVNASLIHEAAIGKIAGEQITKLMTLGLSYEEAEAQIVKVSSNKKYRRTAYFICLSACFLFRYGYINAENAICNKCNTEL